MEDGLVRVGIITDIDTSSRRARVKYADVGFTSDWLPVIQHSGAGVDVEDMMGTVNTFMPRVNDTVLVLYYPIFNADGFILGVI